MRARLLLALMGSSLVGAGTCLADPPEQVPARGHCLSDYLPRLSAWALPSDTGHYVGYHVGGGCGRPHKAEPRRADEGTWGWDYQGWLIPRRVMLEWWHDRRYQGGTGAYKTEGPKLLHED